MWESTAEGPGIPATCISWHDCQSFTNQLNIIEGMNAFRFPTEAEWEYACRAGSNFVYYSEGDQEIDLYYIAYFENITISERLPEGTRTYHPLSAGMKRPNRWGLYDMLGNVKEWCSDWAGPEYPHHPMTPAVDPTGPQYGRWKILRGGSWETKMEDMYCAKRFVADPRKINTQIGFRLAMNI